MKKIIKKLFISSVVEELETEREYLKRVIPLIENDYVSFEPCLCEFNEYFKMSQNNLSNDDPVKICLDKVEECDYYVLLINERYNYQEEHKCSVTELEYRKAKELHKPVFIFIFNDANPDGYARDFIVRLKKERWRFSVKKMDEVKKILTDTLNNLDTSTFINEDPPEGKYFEKKSKVKKTWIIRNSGNVAWENRYMKEVEGGNIFLPEQKLIRIGFTPPGKEFTFTVEYECKSDGNYYSLWKMVDENGVLCFPKEYKGLWINAYVR